MGVTAQQRDLSIDVSQRGEVLSADSGSLGGKRQEKDARSTKGSSVKIIFKYSYEAMNRRLVMWQSIKDMRS